MIKLFIRAGGMVRLVTASGEIIWVGFDRDATGGRKLVIDAPQSVRITRDDVLPEEERFMATKAGMAAGDSRPLPIRERLKQIQGTRRDGRRLAGGGE